MSWAKLGLTESNGEVEAIPMGKNHGEVEVIRS